jgi:hypothetical protein
MNRVKKEELKWRREARRGLSEEEIKKLDEREAAEEKLMKLARKIHSDLFPEEYDFMYDSYADAKSRNMGENPMRKEYADKVNKRRAELGVPPLTENGMAPNDNNSFEIALEIAKKKENLHLINNSSQHI